MVAQGIEIVRDYGLITVNALILGKKKIQQLIMVVDTGACITLIDPKVADALLYSEKESLGKFKVTSPIGVEKGYRIKVKRFEVGRKFQDNFEVGVIPIHDAYGIDGLIGLNFLEKYNLQIKFKENMMWLK